MAISRAQMGSQLRGNKMKKKPVQKKVLGGLMSGGMAPLGIIPQMIYKNQKDKKKAAANSEKEKGLATAKRNRDIMQAAAARGQQPRQMKDGGKLNRADGCVVKGKTKGRMV